MSISVVATIWIAERTLGEWLKRKAQLHAEAGRERTATKNREAPPTEYRAPADVERFGALIRRSDASDSSLWAELANRMSDKVSEGLEEPTPVRERSVTVSVLTTSGLERTMTYTRSLGSHSLTSVIKEPLPPRKSPDSTGAST